MTGGLRRAAAGVRSELGVYRRVLADPRTPRTARWLLGLAVGYAASPVDLIPDWVPVLGYLDDLVVVPLLVWLALRAIPQEVVRAARVGRQDGGRR